MCLYCNLHRRPRLKFHDEVVFEHDDLSDETPDEGFVEFSNSSRLAHRSYICYTAANTAKKALEYVSKSIDSGNVLWWRSESL